MYRSILAACFAVVLGCSVCLADEYRVEPAKLPLPEEVAADVAKQIGSAAFKVSGEKRALCEIWLRRDWPTQAGFTPSQSVLYPFEMGELIGVIRFPKKVTDFRGQDIAAGVYTLRFGLQPVDGNHVGTSETRDFLLLVPASQDMSPAKIDKEDLFKESKEASATTHPAILTLLAVPAEIDAQAVPAMQHDEGRELWSVVLKGTTLANEKVGSQLINFVVVGKAGE